jgi:metal-responsive CopG/Arc/MetJ family transcriptional regulator
MPAKNPRIHVVLEKPLYQAVQSLARKEQISLSLKIRDLVREALETEEDLALAEIVQERDKTFKRVQALSHKQVWGS